MHDSDPFDLESATPYFHTYFLETRDELNLPYLDGVFNLFLVEPSLVVPGPPRKGFGRPEKQKDPKDMLRSFLLGVIRREDFFTYEFWVN